MYHVGLCLSGYHENILDNTFVKRAKSVELEN